MEERTIRNTIVVQQPIAWPKHQTTVSLTKKCSQLKPKLQCELPSFLVLGQPPPDLRNHPSITEPCQELERVYPCNYHHIHNTLHTKINRTPTHLLLTSRHVVCTPFLLLLVSLCVHICTDTWNNLSMAIWNTRSSSGSNSFNPPKLASRYNM